MIYIKVEKNSSIGLVSTKRQEDWEKYIDVKKPLANEKRKVWTEMKQYGVK